MATRTRWGFSLSTFFLAACNGSSDPASKQNADDAPNANRLKREFDVIDS